MAMSRFFSCDACGRSVESWSDGNPYYIGDEGEKRYAYHPNHEELSKCIGNDQDHLCLGCGTEFRIDSRAPIDACPQCNSPDIAATFDLDGRSCPWCQNGTMRLDPDRFTIS